MHTNILGSRWDGDNRYSFENQKKTRQDRICESKRDKDILPSLTFYPHIHLKKKKKWLHLFHSFFTIEAHTASLVVSYLIIGWQIKIPIGNK